MTFVSRPSSGRLLFLSRRSGPGLKLLLVFLVVPFHLVDAVAAELLDHGRSDLEGRDGLGNHAGRGHGADVGAFHARLEGLLRLEVHGAQGLHERGDWLHCRAENDLLAVAHPALDAARVVRLAEEPGLLAPEYLVVDQGARPVRDAEPGAPRVSFISCGRMSWL